MKIRRKGIQNVCRVRTMAIVANEIGLDKVYTDLLPDGKVEKVEELMKQKR